MARVYIGGIECSTTYPVPDSGVFVEKSGIEEWYSLPGVKTDLEDRVGADGSFPVRNSDIAYSERTVTFHLAHMAEDRHSVVSIWERFNALNHQVVPVRVVDKDDTYIMAYIETAFPAEWVERNGRFQVTVYAADPARRSTDVQSVTLMAGARIGALQYPIQYPIDYASTRGNTPTGTVSNRGNRTAYPKIEVVATLVGGFILTDNRNRAIKFDLDTFSASPILVDCERRVVTRSGENVSYGLSMRQWFDVPSGESLMVTFQPQRDVPVGVAWANLTMNDTWI